MTRSFVWSLAALCLCVALRPPPALAQQPDAKALYGRLCVACHGPTGGGDGPVAAALKPKPASFTDPQFQAARTDEQLATAIKGGKPPMPPFGQQLTAAELKALVAYIRQLGSKPR